MLRTAMTSPYFWLRGGGGGARFPMPGAASEHERLIFGFPTAYRNCTITRQNVQNMQTGVSYYDELQLFFKLTAQITDQTYGA